MTSTDRSRDSHPSADEVRDLFLSSWAPEAESPAVRHLLDRCPVCTEAATGMWSGDCAAAHDDESSRGQAAGCRGLAEAAFDAVFHRVRDSVVRAQADLAAERDDARRILARLLGQPLERQLILVSNSRRYQTWSVCELLLGEAWAWRFKEPRRTEARYRVALAVSAGLPVERYGVELVQDLRARCWIGLANGLRILGDLRGAQTALIEAQRLLVAGTGNPLERAGWLDIRASVLIAQRKYREAEECIGRAIQIYFRLGERHALGSALLKRGIISDLIEHVERAIVLTRTGLELVEPERDSSLALAGWLNLIHSMHTAGRDRDALAALAQSRPLYLRSDDRTTVLRFQWLEGSVAAALGRDDQAEGCLREARDGFVQLGVEFAAARVSLELAGVLCRQGRTAEVARLAMEMIAIFESRESGQDTLAAFILLRQAAERERITEALLKRLTGSVREPRARG